jgi:hypothetical protein
MQSSRFASCLADYFALLDCLPGLTYRVHFTGRYTERLRVRSAYHILGTLNCGRCDGVPRRAPSTHAGWRDQNVWKASEE